jgi:hypothetical protein
VNIILTIVFALLSIADAALTIRVLKHGGRELNPLLGENPRPATVVIFAAVTTVVALALAWFILRPYMQPPVFTFFLGVITAVRALAVAWNVRQSKLTRHQ